MNNAFQDIDDEVKVEDIVKKFLNEADDDNKMEVLLPDVMTEFIRRMVDRDDDDAADEIIKYCKSNTRLSAFD